MTYTNYIKMRMCLQCFFVAPDSLTRCPQCGYIFLKEADEEESQRAMDKLEQMKLKAKE